MNVCYIISLREKLLISESERQYVIYSKRNEPRLSVVGAFGCMLLSISCLTNLFARNGYFCIDFKFMNMACITVRKPKGRCCKYSDYFDDLFITDSMSRDDKYIVIINHYKKHVSCDSVLNDTEKSTTIDDAIRLAANARDTRGHKHSHQRRINTDHLSKFCDRILLMKDEIKEVRSFYELFKIIQDCKVDNIGELCIYDTSHRIGAFLGIFPDAIYLHSGTKKGANEVLGKIKGIRVLKNMLPAPFQRDDLSNSEIEDILCIYKNFLKK